MSASVAKYAREVANPHQQQSPDHHHGDKVHSLKKQISRFICVQNPNQPHLDEPDLVLDVKGISDIVIIPILGSSVVACIT